MSAIIVPVTPPQSVLEAMPRWALILLLVLYSLIIILCLIGLIFGREKK